MTLAAALLLSCCCVRNVLSFSGGPAASVCNDASQTPTGHGVSAQTSASPYQLVVGVTSYDSSDTSTPVTGNARVYVQIHPFTGGLVKQYFMQGRIQRSVMGGLNFGRFFFA